MKKMKTAKEMADYAVKNGLSYYPTTETKHFEVVERSLTEDEYVVIPLAPVLGMDTFAVAFTNKRVIIAKKLMFGRSEFNSISPEILTSIHKGSSSFGIVRININTLDDHVINMDFNKKQTDKIISIVSDYLSTHKNKQIESKEQSSNSSVEELQKYFELKKQGIITEEEFLEKKKQLLGL